MRAAGLITKEIPTVVLRLAASRATAQLQADGHVHLFLK
jgi:hypothetical protein